MKTIICYSPSEKEIKDAAEIIRSGGLVAFPTETVYGLGASALSEDAAHKIYKAKGRPSDNPLIIHLAYPEDAERYAEVSPAYRMLSRFMPGPLTVILPKKEIIPDCVTGGLSTVAVRVPSHPVAHALIKAADLPIAAPSANRSGKPSCTTVEHVIHDMSGRIDMILNGGESDFGLESTIVLPYGDKSVKVLRPGGVTVEMLEKAGFEVTLDKAVSEKLADGEVPLAPGMKYRHYAPEATVVLLDGSPEAVRDYMLEHKEMDNIAFIVYDGEEELLGEALSVTIGQRDNSEEYAHKLFSVLRELDEKEGIDTILAPLPAKDHIGLALCNRLMKAAGYTVLSV